MYGFPPKELPEGEAIGKLLSSGDTLTVERRVIFASQEANGKGSKECDKGPSPEASAIDDALATPSGGTESLARENLTSQDSIVSQGKFVRRRVPDDNSCLFRSVLIVLQATEGVDELRTDFKAIDLAALISHLIEDVS